MSDKPGAPEFWQRGFDGMEEALRKTAQVTNALQRGQSNNAKRVDLRVDEVTTEVLFSFARLGNVAVISAQDESAAAELAAGTMYASVEEGKVVVTHGSSGVARRIGVVLYG